MSFIRPFQGLAVALSVSACGVSQTTSRYSTRSLAAPAVSPLIRTTRRSRTPDGSGSRPVPIATGECLTRRQSFRRWFVEGALDIVQPDVTKVGGISEQIRIARMANEFGVKYVGHGWNTALGLAADLQLASALPDADLVEYIGGSPYLDDIVLGEWTRDADGMIEIPEKPGLGVSLDLDALARFTPEPRRLVEP